MAKRIGVLEADEPQTAEPRSHVSKVVAAYLVRKLLAIRVPGRRVIQKLREVAEAAYREARRGFYDGPLGIGNALPFSRQTDGSLLHYEIPHAGDVGLWRHFRKRIQVSARSRFSHQSLAVPATHIDAFALSPNALSE